MSHRKLNIVETNENEELEDKLSDFEITVGKTLEVPCGNQYIFVFGVSHCPYDVLFCEHYNPNHVSFDEESKRSYHGCGSPRGITFKKNP